MLKLGCCLPFPLKFVASCLAATASIYQILWFVFDLIYVILCFLVVVHFK